MRARMSYTRPAVYQKKVMKIRLCLSSFRRYSSSLSLGNELQERVSRLGFNLHLPEENAETRSLALLVGWAESRQKSMAKFAPLYTKRGIACLTVAPRIWSMWFTSAGNKLTSNLLTALDEATPPGDRPLNLVLHLFSGGGTAAFPRLMEEMANPSGLLATRIRPRCVVFDSGPTQFSLQSGSEAAKLVYKQGGFNFVTYAASVLVGATVNLFIGAKKRSELQRALDSLLLDLPQLFLYSEADTVCRREWVERVMEEQRRKGREIESFHWEDSQHVRHLLQHPEEYERLVVDFVKKHVN